MIPAAQHELIEKLADLQCPPMSGSASCRQTLGPITKSGSSALSMIGGCQPARKCPFSSDFSFGYKPRRPAFIENAGDARLEDQLHPR